MTDLSYFLTRNTLYKKLLSVLPQGQKIKEIVGGGGAGSGHILSCIIPSHKNVSSPNVKSCSRSFFWYCNVLKTALFETLCLIYKKKKKIIWIHLAKNIEVYCSFAFIFFFFIFALYVHKYI